ncbi:MAG: glycosyltransferase family 4 protein [Thauera sp.]|nr:glycosyltransferase family 4 protein [Thauera sp.]
MFLITERSFVGLAEQFGVDLDRSRIIELDDGFLSSKKISIFSYFKASRELNRVLQKHDIKVVHFAFPYRVYLPFLYLYARNYKTVLSFVNNVISSAGRLPNWKSALIHHSYFAIVDRIDTFYSYFTAGFPAYEKKVMVAPCSFTDYEKCTYNGEPKDLKIVCVGRLDRSKGVYLLLDALELVFAELDASERNRWSAVYYGRGVEEAGLMTKIKEKGLEGNVRIDFSPRMYEVLKKTSIFVSPHLVENNPSQSLLEAMACENAVVVTDVGDTRLLLDDRHGVISGTTKEGLAQAIVTLIRDDELRIRLARQGRSHVLGSMNIQRFSEYCITTWNEAC